MRVLPDPDVVLLSICLSATACGSGQEDAAQVSEEWTQARGRVATVLEDGDVLALNNARVEVYRVDTTDDATPDFHGDGPPGDPIATAQTDATGRFSLEVPTGWATLRFVAADHTTAFRTQQFEAEEMGVFDVDLRQRPAPLEFTAPQPGDADVILGFNSEAGRSYASLRVEAGDLVTETGSPASGPVRAQIEALHPKDNDKAAFSSSMHVQSADGRHTAFDPVGLLSVELFADGERLEIAPGHSLSWDIEIAAEQRDEAWLAWSSGKLHNYSLDTRTGLWVEESAEMGFDGEKLTVERTHFSRAAAGVERRESFVEQRDPCADPGRHAVILLTFSNPRTPEEVANTLIKTTVEYVSQVETPEVLVVLDDNHNNEYTQDAKFIASKIYELGYRVKVIDEPRNGLTESHVEGYDVVWFLNPGYPIDDRATLETLGSFREAGGGFVLSGDDITLNYKDQADTSPFTFLNYISNGTTTCGKRTDNNAGASYRITFDEDADHLLSAGLGGLSFLYGDDIDHSEPVGDGEKVLAWAHLDNDPSCDVRIPVVVALDLDDSESRPSCECKTDNDCGGEQQCLSNTCLHCGDEESSCQSSDDCCGALACNDGTCGEPCGHAGETCAGAGACCGELTCFGETCEMCTPESGSCETDAGCCGSLLCVDGSCTPCSPNGEGCADSGDCCGSAVCDLQTQTVEIEDEQCAGARELTATVRDFSASHPDFQATIGTDRGIVATQLGLDGKPVYAHEQTHTTHGAEAFAQWFNDTPGVNEAIEHPMILEEVEDGVYQYRNNAFFPIDGRGLGDEGRSHNYHFTLDLHSEFIYRGGESFTFTGDDDLFVFINGQLAIDLGGVHGQQSQTVDLDQAARALGLEVGSRYPLDIFFAERHTVASNFRIDTTIGCLSNRRTEEVVVGRCAQPEPEDPECHKYEASVIGLDALEMHGESMVLQGEASGSVGSNGNIKLTGSAMVEGNASVANGEINLHGSASVRGESTLDVAEYEADVPTDAFDRALYANNNERIEDALQDGKLTLKRSETLHLEAGDYSIRDLKLVNSSSITCEGEVRIFIEEKLKMANEATLGSPGSCNLLILSEGTKAISLSNEAKATASIFAPLAEVALHNGTKLEGSIVARKVRLTGQSSVVAAAEPFGVICDPTTPEEPEEETDGTTSDTGDDSYGETGNLPPLPDVAH